MRLRHRPSTRSTRSVVRSTAAIAVLTATLAALPACGSGSDTSSDAGTGSATDVAPSQLDAAAVAQAIDFRAPLVGGGTFDGAAHTTRPVAFWFWAPT